MKLKRVVVTGLGALTPLGNTCPELWESLVNGVSGADMITHFDASKFKTRFACELKNFDPKNYLDRKEARKQDPYSQYAMVSSDEAVKDSGIDFSKVNKERGGVIWASGIGGILTFYDEVRSFINGDGTPRFNPFFIPKMIANIASGHISIKHGLMGPNFSTVSACASAANGIADAFNYIRLGKADFFITGGSEAAINKAGMGGFNALHAISTRNDDPKTASRPFDKDRDGFVMGEGGCSLILEEMEHAINRGANIYCELVGAGLSGDANHITAPHPDGLGAIISMREAINDANLKLEDIDCINTHGTSTPVGDIAEPTAIVTLFKEHAYKPSVCSTKSMTGHLLGAAGAVEAIASILTLKNNIVPPTINHFTDDENIPKLNFTFNEPHRKEINTVLSNTFGFGGQNASLVFKTFSE